MNSTITLLLAAGSADPSANNDTVLSLPMASVPTGVGISAKSSFPQFADASR